jgi:hypothetical protein
MDNKKTRVPLTAPHPCSYLVWDERKEQEVWYTPGVNCDHVSCDRCAWNHEEAERRAQIPLTLCSDGLRRKFIPRRRPKVETTNQEGGATNG